MNGATDTTLELRRAFSECAALQPDAPKPNEIPNLSQSFGNASGNTLSQTMQVTPQLQSPDMGTVGLVGQSLTQPYEGLKCAPQQGPQGMVSEMGGQTMKLGGEFFGQLFGQKQDTIVPPPQMQMAMNQQPRGPGFAGIF
jgi:hypothetical protein